MTGPAVTDLRRPVRAAHTAARLPRQLRNPYRVPRPAVISFSGGRTSGYLLKHVIDAYGGRLPDGVFVVFANTAMERRETLEFIDTCATAWSTTVHWIEYCWDVNRLSILTPDRRAKLTPLSGTAEVVPVVNRGDPRGFV